MNVDVQDRAAGPSSALMDALQTLKDRWWMVVVAMIGGAVIAFAVAIASTKEYTGESSLLIRQSNLQTLIDPNATQGSEDPARLAATNLLLVTSTAVAKNVQTTLGTNESASALLAQISASANPDADIITIQATDPSPSRAARIANAFADQFVAFERAQSQVQAQAGATRLRGEIAALPAGSTESVQLEQALRNLLALQAVTTGDATVVDRATPSSSPSSPNLKRAPVLGLLAGLAIGLAAVFLSDLFDRRIKTIEEFESAYGRRAIGSLPRLARPQPGTSPELLESFRILRSALSYLGSESDLRTVLVTSAVSGEGKTTVAAGLAYATALAGQQVVLIEADLRRPSFQKQFDIENQFELGLYKAGLTNVLMRDATVQDVLHTPIEGLNTLKILPSGPFSPHPSDLLLRPEMAHMIEELAGQADLVIIDSPPLLPVADAQVLIAQPVIDASLIVCRTYMTTRDQARRCRAVLERERVRNAALVVVGGHEPAEYSYEPITNGRGRGRKRVAANDDQLTAPPLSGPGSG
ncbi:MAG: polysaccharide biosynthesis tyrosine autokinase [Solirubrobacterales bacterium]|nr:polysaccharide biosynthesis tyrosine autokinase [Solirubrobacterales bacterium]